jgi:hypothetical protein
MQTGILEGDWWLPETPDDKVPGVLTIQWGARPGLELQGLLRPMDVSDAIRLTLVRGEGYPIVHGKAADGREVTLEGTSSTGGNELHLREPGRSIIRLKAGRAWLGALLAEPATEKYALMHMRLGRLTDLTTRPSTASVDGATIELVPAHPTPTTGTAPIRTERAELRVRLDDPMQIDDLIDIYVRPLRNLIALATGRDVVVDELILGHRIGASADQRIEVVEKRREMSALPDRRLLPSETLFDFDSLPTGFEDAIRRWLVVGSHLRAILDLFAGPLFAPFMYEEHRFLNFAQAVESYHRIQYDGTLLPPDEYAKHVDAAVNACPPDLKAWLRGSLEYGNQLSSFARLRALLDQWPWMEGEVIAQFKPFARRVTDTRNYHTHWDETTRGDAASGLQLWRLNEQLAVLLQACLLDELGFSMQEAANSIRRASTSYSAIRMNPDQFPGTHAKSNYEPSGH